MLGMKKTSDFVTNKKIDHLCKLCYKSSYGVKLLELVMGFCGNRKQKSD